VRPDRYRSETERRFAALLTAWQQQDVITHWWYEPCKGLYLAPHTSYTPDFLVSRSTGPLVFYEVKGAYIRPQDWVKAKQAAALYGCFWFFLAQWETQEWCFKEIPHVDAAARAAQ